MSACQCPELKDHDCENDQLTLNPDILQDLLLQLDPQKSIGPDEIHLRILKELADVIAKPPSMIFELSWKYREVPADWKLMNVVLVFRKDNKKDLGGIEKHLKDNTVLDHSQDSLVRGKSCLPNLISFCDKVTHLVDQVKPADTFQPFAFQ
ncbi:hypothetical protein BTVI_29482 [Pitangus sulphuratus]|nr:hypothetical protein BTVI_29482 [Pitangus sulphuratus]